MEDEMPRPAPEAHIEVNSYTVRVGQAEVEIKRLGAGWELVARGARAVNSAFPPAVFALEERHEQLVTVAVEYAKRIDAVLALEAKARQAWHETHMWLREAPYRLAEQGKADRSA